MFYVLLYDFWEPWITFSQHFIMSLTKWHRFFFLKKNDVFIRAVRQENKIKDIEIRKGEVKLSALAETVRTNTWVQQGCWIVNNLKMKLNCFIYNSTKKIRLARNKFSSNIKLTFWKIQNDVERNYRRPK